VNIALLPGGRTITAEKGINRVKVYDSNGKVEAYLGPELFDGRGLGLDVAADSRGRICVADPGDGKVKIFARPAGKGSDAAAGTAR
jgi:hypothetical protein